MPYFSRSGEGSSCNGWEAIPTATSSRTGTRSLGTSAAQLERALFRRSAGNIIMSTFSAPFTRKAGRRQLAGVVGADVSLLWLKDIVAAVKIYQTGYAFLISKNGSSSPIPNLS